MRHIRDTGLLALALLGSFVTCSDERPGSPPGVGGTSALGGSAGTNGGPDAGLVDAGDAGGAGGVAGAGGAAGAGEDVDASVPGEGGTAGDAGSLPSRCDELTCRGVGRCIVQDGAPTCACDEGYELVDEQCVVDDACIRLRPVEPGCRQRLGQEPALGMFFMVETCAGTTVPEAILGNVTQAFRVVEGDGDLGEESYSVILDRDVESLIVIALDLSNSVTDDPGLLASVITSVGGLVGALEPEPGEPRVSVELVLFGRSVHVDTPFTTDLGLIADRLAELQSAPDGVVDDPAGTNLNGVINLALGDLEAAWAERMSETGGASTSTGTLVIITDGKDTSGVTLDPIDPRFNLISVGVSQEIDDAELTRVGPQGSFLAPTPADLDAAFAAVAQRIREYRERIHLLAYCSPAIEGSRTLQVALTGLEAERNATCTFDAELFGIAGVGAPFGSCNAAFVSGYCSGGHGCGSFLACGLPCSLDAGTDPTDEWAFPD